MGLPISPLDDFLMAATNPYVLVPALILGLWCRRFPLVLAGALLIAGIHLALSLTGPQMQGFRPNPLAEPMAFLAPLALAIGTFWLRRWSGRRNPTVAVSIVSRIAFVLVGMALGFGLGFILGLVIGYTVVTIGQLGDSRESAGYIVGFAFILPGMLLGPFLGGAIGWWYAGRVARAAVR